MTQKIFFEATTDSIAELEGVLRENGSSLSIAQIHGTLTGLVCIGQNETTFHQWGNLLTPKYPAQSLLDTMFTLMYFTKRCLEAPDFRFGPILCSNHKLVERTESLSDWCQGFIIGFGLDYMDQVKNPIKDTEIFLSDIAELSLMEAGIDNEEEEERAFFELEQYVKIGVQLLYEEFYSDCLTASRVE